MSTLLLKVALQLEAEVYSVTLSEAEMDLTPFRSGVLCKYKKNVALSNPRKLQGPL